MTNDSLSGLERRIGRILRLGVATSTGLLIAGLVLWLAQMPLAPKVLNAGLFVLIAVPISRILASFVDALRRRDHLLSGATAAVLLVLALTIAYSLLVSPP